MKGNAEKVRAWESHQALAVKLASQFAAHYEMPHSELVIEANAILTDELFVRQKYDSTKGASITSWLYKILYWKLLDYCSRNRDPAIPFSAFDTEEIQCQPAAKPNRVQRLLQELSEEGQFLVHIVINAPAEIVDDISPQTKAKGRRAVQKYMLETCHWDQAKLDRAWQEVQECL